MSAATPAGQAAVSLPAAPPPLPGWSGPAEEDLAGQILTQAFLRPGAPALISGDSVTTYGALLTDSSDLLAELESLGARQGEVVAVLATKTPRTVATVLACLRGRLPVLLVSGQLPDTLREGIMDAAGTRIVVDTLGRISTRGQGRRACPPGTALLLTTSGSTGAPKVVPLSRLGMHLFAGWARESFQLGRHSTLLSLSPLNFDLSLLELWTGLACGATVVLVGQGESVRGERVLDRIVQSDVDLVQAVPMFYQLMAAAGRRPPGLDRVRHALITGDAISRGGLAQVFDLFPRAQVTNVYGATETNDSFIQVLDRNADPARMPIGSPLPGVQALLVDAQGGVVKGPGSGELYVNTPFQTCGYLDEDQTRQRFVQHVGGDHPSRVYFRSGDLASRGPDGKYLLLGRMDRQVKVRGTAVNLTQVENVLADHPGVRTAAVCAEEDAVAGHTVTAIVHCTEPAPTLPELRAHCAALLPRAAVPGRITISDEPLPETTTGKIDRRKALQISMLQQKGNLK